MSRIHYLKCSCQQCGEHIEFPSDGLGMKILCPHCGGQTQLVSEKVPLSPQKKIIIAAALRPMLTFRSFGRHDGTTESKIVRTDHIAVDGQGSGVVGGGDGELPARRRGKQEARA